MCVGEEGRVQRKNTSFEALTEKLGDVETPQSPWGLKRGRLAGGRGHYANAAVHVRCMRTDLCSRTQGLGDRALI